MRSFLLLIFSLLTLPTFAQKECTQVLKIGGGSGAWLSAQLFSGQSAQLTLENYISPNVSWGLSMQGFSGKKSVTATKNTLVGRQNTATFDIGLSYFFGGDALSGFYAGGGLGAGVERQVNGILDEKIAYRLEMVWSPFLKLGYHYRLNESILLNFYGDFRGITELGFSRKTEGLWSLGFQFGYVLK